MTDKQWMALEKMTESKWDNFFFSTILSIGEVTIRRVLEHYELEYPSYSVSLYRDRDINGTDLLYLRYLYNEWLSSI
jgi:predicted ATP-grasp superfamily ATP-dependent carboligase